MPSFNHIHFEERVVCTACYITNPLFTNIKVRDYINFIMSKTCWDESHVESMCEAFGIANVVKI